MPKIFLVGMPASGKTTIGAKLAKRLGYRFIDLDHYIEKKESKTIATIFREAGENAFRALERLYLFQLKDEDDTVISTGGGTATFHDNMKWMNSHGFTIYLKEDLETIIQRNLENTRNRPLFSNKSEKEIKDKMYFLLENREPLYSTAALIINKTNGNTNINNTDNQYISEINKILQFFVDFK